MNQNVRLIYCGSDNSEQWCECVFINTNVYKGSGGLHGILMI